MNTLMLKSPRILSLIVMVILLSVTGCKSKKKAMEAQAAAERERLEQQAALERQQREEEQRRAEAEAKAKRDADSKAREPYNRLDLYFSNIANSANVNAANNSIFEALTMFSSPDAPVLIVIHQEGSQKDYDKPTTIREYLNYLKDQKKNAYKINNLQFDEGGKITEVELTKSK